MGGLPYLPTYVSEFLREPVSGSSLAAQGLWLRLRMLAHDADRYGYLAHNGRGIPQEAIAARCTCHIEQLPVLLAELERYNALSRTPDNVIYFKDMVERAKVRSMDIGRKRMSRECPTNVHNIDTCVKKQKAVQEQTPEETLYGLFPKKKDRGHAIKAIRKALTLASFDVLKAGVERYAKSRQGEDPTFTKFPATWFNGQCWLDEPDDETGFNSANPKEPDGCAPCSADEAAQVFKDLGLWRGSE